MATLKSTALSLEHAAKLAAARHVTVQGAFGGGSRVKNFNACGRLSCSSRLFHRPTTNLALQKPGKNSEVGTQSQTFPWKSDSNSCRSQTLH